MFKKNTAVTGFCIGHFIQTADGAAKTTGTPTCKRLLDGVGAALTNAAAYDSDAGVWKIDLAAGDTNADLVGLSFTLTDCLPISYVIRTGTKLVSELQDPTVATIQSGLATSAALATAQADLDNPSQYKADVSALALQASVDDLETRLTATRAGYLDNLSAGVVPTAAQIATAVWAATTRTLSSFGTLVADVAAAVWAYASRTLTQSGASVAATVSGTTITAVRGDTFVVALTNLGAITGYTNIWFTVKLHDEDTDAESLLQVDADNGLLYANGAAGTPANGSITVDDDPTGDITVKVAASVMDDMQQCVARYDVQWMNASGEIYTLSQGIFQVTLDQTRAVS